MGVTPLEPGAPRPADTDRVEGPPAQRIAQSDIRQSADGTTPAGGGEEQWVFVDPSSYSNPYSEAPVYSSGPQTVPTAQPQRVYPETQAPNGIPPQPYPATPGAYVPAPSANGTYAEAPQVYAPAPNGIPPQPYPQAPQTYGPAPNGIPPHPYPESPQGYAPAPIGIPAQPSPGAYAPHSAESAPSTYVPTPEPYGAPPQPSPSPWDPNPGLPHHASAPQSYGLPPQTYGPAPTASAEGGPGWGVPPSPIGGSQAAAPPPDPLLSSSYQPEKGELKIKERRTWKSWQLLLAVLLAAGLGMWINALSGPATPSSAGSSSGSSGGYKLPPASGSSPSSAASHGTGSSTSRSGAGTTATTAAGSATTTTSASGAGSSTTPSSVALGPVTVLIPQVEQSGNWTSPAFNIAGGTWNIGWAFQCTPAPSASPSFQIFVVNNGGTPGSTPAVTSAAASGSAVTPETTTGSQQIIVQTSAACRWAAKVSGSST
jgi:hypothetical protein